MVIRGATYETMTPSQPKKSGLVGRPLKPESMMPVEGRKRLKLTRDREHKRRLRVEYVQEVENLKETIISMSKKVEMLLRSQRHVRSLPWRDVALALKDAVDESRQTNHALRADVRRFQSLAAYMHTFLSPSNPVPWRAVLQSASWRDAYLFADDNLRQSGYDWITTSMRHSAPLDLHRHPDDLTPQTSVKLDGDAIRFSYMHSIIVPTTLAHATNMARRHPLEVQEFRQQKPNVTTVVDRTAEGIMYLRNTGVPGHAMNCVTRVYEDRESSLLVTRSVVDDEAHPYAATDYRSDIREWTYVKCLSDGTCLLRQYMSFTQPFLNDKVLSLAEFAPLFLGSARAEDFANLSDDVVLHRVLHKFEVCQPRAQRIFEMFFHQLRLSTPDGPMAV